MNKDRGWYDHFYRLCTQRRGDSNSDSRLQSKLGACQLASYTAILKDCIGLCGLYTESSRLTCYQSMIGCPLNQDHGHHCILLDTATQPLLFQHALVPVVLHGLPLLEKVPGKCDN